MRTIAAMSDDEVSDYMQKVCEQAEKIVPADGMVLLILCGAGRTYYMLPNSEQVAVPDMLRELADRIDHP